MGSYSSYNRRHFGLLLSLIIISVFAACSPSLSTPETTFGQCDWVDEPRLRALQYGEMTTKDMIAWLREQYGITQVQLDNAYPEGAKEVSWLTSDKDYHAIFFDDRLVRVVVAWDEPLPTGYNILHCFGQPSYYNATFTQDIEARDLSLELWYPALGLNIATWLFTHSEMPPTVDGELGFRLMSISKPGDTVDELLNNMVVLPQRQTWVLSSIRTWPSNWEAIEIENRIP